MNLAIYMEGGGDGKDSKAALREGMEMFLAEVKDTCRARNWHWKLVCCGSRNEAYKRFQNERIRGEAGIVVLLVDSEAPVDAGPADHLAMRDGWNLDGIDNETIHLMVQSMETWIVADRDALRAYYGQGFQENAIPRHRDLEDVSKRDIAAGLGRATTGTQKGPYHKIRHARHLLQRIDPTTVRQRCRHCERLFETLLRLIAQNDEIC